MKYLRRLRLLFLDHLEMAVRLEAAEQERAELAKGTKGTRGGTDLQW